MHEKIGKLKLGFSKTYFTINFGKMLKIIFHDYKIRNLFVSYYVCFSFFLFFVFVSLTYIFFQRPALRIKVNPELKKSIEIDQSLKKDVPDTNHHVRVLLLGTGESGKSTVVKQMKVRNLQIYLLIKCVFYY